MRKKILTAAAILVIGIGANIYVLYNRPHVHRTSEGWIIVQKSPSMIDDGPPAAHLARTTCHDCHNPGQANGH